MTVAGTVSKQPFEEFPIDLDFANDLATGETISSVDSVTAKNVATGVDSSATVLKGTPTISGTKVIHAVKAGASGERHRVQFRIITSNGNRYEGEVDVAVQEV